MLLRNANYSMTAQEAPRKPRLPVMCCPYCVESGNFKVMIGQHGLGALVHALDADI
jgi:hypothetical protein